MVSMINDMVKTTLMFLIMPIIALKHNTLPLMDQAVNVAMHMLLVPSLHPFVSIFILLVCVIFKHTSYRIRRIFRGSPPPTKNLTHENLSITNN